jgi:hypothetical protein
VQNNGIARREAISCLQEQRGNTTDNSQNGEPSCVGNSSTQESCCKVYEVYARLALNISIYLAAEPTQSTILIGEIPAYYTLYVFKPMHIRGHRSIPSSIG